ncbi:SecY-interacting protein Syd [uncultured Clostridium sp.]|uniref:SecY-interacting protein Syd n=1 Tax=uncultured Clostridium sp. TaxID=59620 RepID=UPI0028EE0958|nr:SecY-interacting protein Syd [uncultured Clostridium sp.]
MSVKKALNKYFEKMINGYSKTKQGLPMRPKKVLDNENIYVGMPDEEGWCKWKPIKKNKISNFEDIEKIFGVNINEDIKEYFNSYWFLELEGEFKKKDITLEVVVPERELEVFQKKLIGYKEAHNNELKYIPIGMEEEHGYLIVMENSTGKIKIENHDKGTFRTIANNLEELLTILEPSIIDLD